VIHADRIRHVTRPVPQFLQLTFTRFTAD